MIVQIIRNVPGTVDMRYVRNGDVLELADGAALSLISDGYAEEVTRTVPAETAERAAQPSRGRRGTRT